MAEEPVIERGVLTAPVAVWDTAVRQAEVIGPLAEKSMVGWAEADEAAAVLEVSRRQVYVLLGRWRAGEGVVSDLLPGRPNGGRGGGRLPDEVEAVIAEVLRVRHLTRQRRSVAVVSARRSRASAACAACGPPRGQRSHAGSPGWM